MLLYVPYQLATGAYLSTPNAIAALGIAYLAVAAFFSYRLARRYFRSTATALDVLVCYLALVAASNVMYLGFVSRFYSVPILSSMMLTLAGLWFWLGAKRPQHAPGAPLSARHLAAGSALLALNFGCRPQFLLSLFLAFPLFWTEITRERTLFSRQGAKATAAGILPTVVIMLPLMWYNYARFGSPLNFGSSYNLTGFDMTSYAQSWKTTGAVLFSYLFQPVDFTRSFPFVKAIPVDLSAGWAPTEPMFGGIFFLVPCLLLVFLIVPLREALSRKGLLPTCAVMLLFSAIVLLVDTRAAGVTQRYFSDFTWYLAIVSCLVFLTARSMEQPAVKRAAAAFTVCALAFSIAVGGLSFFSPERLSSFPSLNPEGYEAVVQALRSVLPY